MVTTDWPPYTTPLSKTVLASFWRRLGALIADTTLLAIGVPTILAVMHSAGVRPQQNLVQFIVATSYFVYLNGRGETLGKALFGIRVINRFGTAPGIKRSAARYALPMIVANVGFLLTVISLISSSSALNALLAGLIIWMAGIALGAFDSILMVWHPQKQTLHDVIAGTYVVRVKEFSMPETRSAEVDGPGMFPHTLRS
jgi:uncharacterized RDD family membrane protein YckC